MTVARGFYSVQALFQALQENIFGQFDADEHHFAHSLFTNGPFGAQIAAHELVHPLENDFAVSTFHVEHTLVAQHLGAIDVDDSTQKVFQLNRVKLTFRLEDKAFHIVIMVVMVPVSMVVRRVIAMITVLMIVIVKLVLPLH